jgi:hypothetical protein
MSNHIQSYPTSILPSPAKRKGRSLASELPDWLPMHGRRWADRVAIAFVKKARETDPGSKDITTTATASGQQQYLASITSAPSFPVFTFTPINRTYSTMHSRRDAVHFDQLNFDRDVINNFAEGDFEIDKIERRGDRILGWLADQMRAIEQADDDRGRWMREREVDLRRQAFVQAHEGDGKGDTDMGENNRA